MSTYPTPVKKLSLLYDYLYSEADKILKQHDPCNITVIKTYGVSFPKCSACTAKLRLADEHALCCSRCPHHKLGHGCTVKALFCKVWLCWSIKPNSPATEKLHTLEIIGHSARLLFYRASKEESFARRQIRTAL